MAPAADNHDLKEPGRPAEGFGAGKSGAPEAYRAEPPRPPQLSRAAQQDEEERKRYLLGRELLERRSVMRGLILLAVFVLVVSLLRAGGDRVFPAGWWHRW